MSFVVSQILSG